MNMKDLIASTRGDRSYEELAKAHPESPSRQRWHQLGSGKAEKEFPEPATVRGMALVLNVAPATVIAAYSETLGFTLGERSRLADLLPPGVQHLTDGQIAAVLSVIRQFLLQGVDGREQQPARGSGGAVPARPAHAPIRGGGRPSTGTKPPPGS